MTETTHPSQHSLRGLDGLNFLMADVRDAWPERGILGTQLGPNRNGRQW